MAGTAPQRRGVKEGKHGTEGGGFLDGEKQKKNGFFPIPSFSRQTCAKKPSHWLPIWRGFASPSFTAKEPGGQRGQEGRRRRGGDSGQKGPQKKGEKPPKQGNRPGAGGKKGAYARVSALVNLGNKNDFDTRITKISWQGYIGPELRFEGHAQKRIKGNVGEMWKGAKGARGGGGEKHGLVPKKKKKPPAWAKIFRPPWARIQSPLFSGALIGLFGPGTGGGGPRGTEG